MPKQHVLTLSSDVPPSVLDRVLSAVQSAYEELGEGRTWIEASHRDIVVMAETPTLADRTDPV